MIKLDFAIAVSLYIMFSTICVLLAWVYFDRNKFKKYTSDDVYFWRCVICTHSYVDSLHKEISACPVCGSYNKRN